MEVAVLPNVSDTRYPLKVWIGTYCAAHHNGQCIDEDPPTAQLVYLHEWLCCPQIVVIPGGLDNQFCLSNIAASNDVEAKQVQASKVIQIQNGILGI